MPDRSTGNPYQPGSQHPFSQDEIDKLGLTPEQWARRQAAQEEVRKKFEQTFEWHEAQRQERVKAQMEELLRGMGGNYRAFVNEDLLREAFTTGLGAGLGGRHIPRDQFQQPMPPPPARDPRIMARLRDLKRMRDGTTFEGERANAQSAMDRIMAKHGISADEV